MDIASALRVIDQVTNGAPRALAAAGALATAAAVHAGQPVLYVDHEALAGGDGRSWTTAMRDLQDALDAARLLGGDQVTVRIADGLYRPDRGTGDRAASFTLTSGMVLMGGFAGLGAANPDARDPAAFATVLSGDLAGNDIPGGGPRGDNSYHVVDASRVDPAYLSGLTIRGGNADGAGAHATGGGILISGGSFAGRIYLNNCVLRDNRASVRGGAIGGAGGSSYGVVALVDCLVEDNAAITGNGGGIAAQSVELARSVVRSNRSGGMGGGVWATSGIKAESCLFAGNEAAQIGGAIAGDWLFAMVNHCTFVANRAADAAAIAADYFYNESSWPTGISANIFDRNTTTFSAGTLIVSIATISMPVRFNLVNGGLNTLLSGGAAVDASNLSADPRFVSVAGEDGDVATLADNDYRLRPDSPAVDVVSGLETHYATDLSGNPRRTAGGCLCRSHSDIGAFELPAGSCPAPPLRVYVSADAPPDGDGLSWATAKRDLNSALGVPGAREVWIKAGVYRLAGPDGLPSPDASIEIGCQMTVRGGFAGTESTPDQRPPLTAGVATIFSGDLLGNDTGETGSRSDNTATMLRIIGAAVALDRLVIERAASDGGYGAQVCAVVVNGASVTLTDCTIRDCIARTGAALNAFDSTVMLDRCRLERNISTSLSGQNANGYGGAIVLDSCACTIVDSDLSANRVLGAGYGGAIAASNTLLEVRSSRFRSNRVFFDRPNTYGTFLSGGAIHSGWWDRTRPAGLVLVNCIFTGNSVVGLSPAGECSGGAIGGSYAPWRIVGCVFARNSAFGLTGASGGATHATNLAAEFTNCTLAENAAEGWFAFGRVGGVSWAGTGGPTLTNCILWANRDDVSTGSLAQLGAPPGTPGAASVSNSIIQGWASGAGPDARGNLGADPKLTTEWRPQPLSPAIDRGNSAAFPTTEVLTDAGGGTRLHDDPQTPNQGGGPVAYLDLGAFEFRGAACAADLNESGGLDTGDLFLFLAEWFSGGGRADFNGDGLFTLQDLFEFLAAYLATCD